MQLSSVSTIQKPHRHRNHRKTSSVVHRHIGTDCGNPLQADALHFQRHLMAALVDGVDTQCRMTNDKAKRSDTAKRHVLARQKPILKDEHRTPSSLKYAFA